MKILFSVTGTLVVVSFITISACKSTKKSLTAAEIAALPKVMEFSKSACRGTCPYFDLTFYKGGWMIFDGKRHTAQNGKATAKLSKEEWKQFQQHCDAADLWSCAEGYGMNVQDIPTTTIHFYEKNRDKKVKWRMRQPERLSRFDNQIMELVYQKGWVSRPSAQSPPVRTPPAATIDEQIIVHLKGNKPVEEWLKSYTDYGLRTLKQLSKSMPIYLLEFDKNSITPSRMLELIRMDGHVESANFNKRVSIRN